MLVTAIKERLGDGCRSLSCELRSRHSRSAITFEIDCADERRPALADFAVCAALPLAAQLGEDLHVDGIVSRPLLQNAEGLAEIYSLWIDGASRIGVTAAECEESRAPECPGRGLFFSCGVDSFYSWLKHRCSITHLISVQGFDIALDNPSLFEQVYVGTKAAAHGTNIVPVRVRTDLRQVSEPILSWEMYFGAALAAVAHAIGNPECLIASSHSWAEPVPWGSSPLLDPLFSGSAVRIVHDGYEVSRLKKVRAIAGDELVRRHLRVCWRDPVRYNCGHCEKCLRTRMELYLAGAGGECASLGGAPETDSVAKLSILSRAVAPMWHDIAAALGNEAQDELYREGINNVLKRSGYDDLVVRPTGLVDTTKLSAVYEPGSVIRFDKAGNFGAFCGDGWSRPESWGTWTDGYRATLTLAATQPFTRSVVLCNCGECIRQTSTSEPLRPCRL